MERKIGEIFDYNDQKLKVVETKDNSCRGCYFLDLRYRCYQQLCMPYLREDRKNVIFQSIE